MYKHAYYTSTTLPPQGAGPGGLRQFWLQCGRDKKTYRWGNLYVNYATRGRAASTNSNSNARAQTSSCSCTRCSNSTISQTTDGVNLYVNYATPTGRRTGRPPPVLAPVLARRQVPAHVRAAQTQPDPGPLAHLRQRRRPRLPAQAIPRAGSGSHVS